MIMEGSAIAIGKFIYDMYQSDKLDSQAKTTTLKAMNRMEEAKAAQRKKMEEAKLSMLRLGNRKKGILIGSIKTFVEIYETIKKINFVDSEVGFDESNLPAVMIQDMYAQIAYAGASMSSSETVCTFVVNSLFWGTAGGISSLIKKDSQRNLETAHIQAKQARAVASQANIVSLAYEAIIERSDRITDVLTKLNFLFVKSLICTKDIIYKNENDKKKYSLMERKELATCINLAKAVKVVIDTPLLDETGEITAQSMEAICAGEECLQQINQAINH